LVYGGFGQECKAKGKPGKEKEFFHSLGRSAFPYWATSNIKQVIPGTSLSKQINKEGIYIK